MFGKRTASGAIGEMPPVYGANGSAVPWKMIAGTGRRSVHQVQGSVCAAPTIPTAAMRSESVHERTKAMPPPFEKPFA